MGDVVFHQMLVQQVSDPQFVVEYKNGCAFTVVLYFGQLILEVADVCFETVGGPLFDGKEVMIVLLEILTGGVLSEKQPGEISEAVD